MEINLTIEIKRVAPSVTWNKVQLSILSPKGHTSETIITKKAVPFKCRALV